MKQFVLLAVLFLLCNIAAAQDAEIIEAQRRVAIISSGSEQGIQKSDTLWVIDVSEKKDHLVAKAKVIALRQRFSAIEAFQYFGAYRLAIGQRVYRIKEVPAPLTSPPPRITRQKPKLKSKPGLTLAEVYRQRTRLFIFERSIEST